MNDKLKIVFIGGLENGLVVLEYLTNNKYVSVPIVVTHPEKHDVPQYADLADSTNKNTKIIRDLNTNNYFQEIKAAKPDFIFVAGWSGLLLIDFISIPNRGTIGFHPSKLPKDRGRSVLAWQIEEGYTETALSMFYYNVLPDCGDIIAQERIKIEENDYIIDVLNKVTDATYNLMRAYFPLLRIGVELRKKQDINEGNFRRLRTDRDSLIKWDQNARVIYNKVRAISKPYPGAFFIRANEKIKIWKSEIVENDYFSYSILDSPPGKIIEKISKLEYIVRCRDKFLKILTDKEIQVESK